MAQRIVLISGPIGVGKTTLSENLRLNHDARLIKTRDLLSMDARFRLQILRSRADALFEMLKMPGGDLVVVDTVKRIEQVNAIRKEYGQSVFHIHLKADRADLRKRFHTRQSSFIEARSYDEARRNATEAGVDSLESKADAVVNTSYCLAADVLTRAATHLHLFSRDYTQLVDVVVGGQFGSEGKGHIASFLAREYDVLVRVGGPNAGHKVFESPDPYTHHHLPCGSRGQKKSQLVIAPGSVIDPIRILKEIEQCGVSPEQLSIDPQAMLITEQDRVAEALLIQTIGSTGMGVSTATARRIMERSVPTMLAKDCHDLFPYIRETRTILERAYAANKRVLVEGNARGRPEFIPWKLPLCDFARYLGCLLPIGGGNTSQESAKSNYGVQDISNQGAKSRG
jgi:adenylosuccinate synthase